MTIRYQLGSPRKLSAEEKQFYLDNGFWVARGLFKPEECDEILDRLKFYKRRNGAAMMNLDREYELSRFVQEKMAEERSLELGREIRPEEIPVEDIPFDHVIETAWLMRLFMRDPRQISLLRQLHEGPYEERAGKTGLKWGGLMTQVIFKEAGTQYGDQAWNPHQDNSYVLNPNGLYVTTNTFFADADMENGTMYIYPGSHKKGILPFEEIKSYREEKGKNPGNMAAIPEGCERVDLEFGKGDTLYLNGDVVHGSYPNKSPTRSRPLYMNIYIPEGEYFRPGRESRKMFQPIL